ncbi:MAG: tetratricopeptide repeat protein [Desulforhopalus sp.]
MSAKSKSNQSIITEVTTPLSHDHIQQQLEKIIASPEFHATSQQCDFLTFVVTETLAGRSGTIKGYTVATQVFGRTEDFDAQKDPIVSIQANKLRRALERYYLVVGKLDPIRIDIPKGAYIPTFVRQNRAEISTVADGSAVETVTENAWPTILILPFKNLTGDPDNDFWGSGISSELAIGISRFENIRVLYPREGMPQNIISIHPRFILSGEFYMENSGIKLAIFLVDTKTGIQIWGDTCRTGGNLADLYSFQQQVAQGVATIVCGEFGIITRTISRETNNKSPEKLSTYEAVLRFWEYEQTMTPETFGRAFTALTHAVKIEPDCCLTLGSLAILYGTIHNLDIPGFEDPLEKAVHFAEKAAAINPNNQRVLVILAYIRFISNELTTAIHEAHRALELNPYSLFVLDGLAWILTLSGDWKQGPELAQKAINLNPFHRAVAHDALWLNHIRLENYELAYAESCNLQRPNLFWDQLIKASTLGLVGRYKTGRKVAEKLLTLRPDFPVKGRVLIGNYIKFDEISNRVLEGLARSGVTVN